MDTRELKKQQLKLRKPLGNIYPLNNENFLISCLDGLFTYNRISKKLKKFLDIRKKNEINKIKVEGSAGAGAVKVVAKGNHQIVSIEIDNDTHTGNKKILEDYLIAACNDAMNKLEKETKDKMGSVMNLPGGMKLPF